MIIFGICLGVIIIGILLTINYKTQEPGGVVLASGIISFAVALISLPLFLSVIRGEIKEFQAVEQTIQVSREKASEIEKAALQHKVIDANTWLASKQYWNGTLFDIWIPDEVMKLKPLK